MKKKCKSGRHTYPATKRQCKECKREKGRTWARKAYAANPEKRAYMADYYVAHRDELAARNADYYETHRDEIAAYMAAYRATHRDEIAAQKADYYAANRDAIAAQRAAHRDERLMKYAKLRAKAIAYLGGKCAVCGATDELDFDHETPALKSFNISKRFTWRWSVVIEAELRKCQLLCRKHHVLKTLRENPQRPQIAKALHAAPRGGTCKGDHILAQLELKEPAYA
jgi:hypothetical protein